jgi:drug/metabolite transporter (DMT)-like permease
MTTLRQSDDGRQPVGPSSATLAILTSFLWGGTPVAIKYSQDVLPPIGVAAARFLLAAGFMVVWCMVQRVGLGLERGQRRPALICGLLLYVQISLFHLGLHSSSPSHGSLLINTFVLWVAAFEHFITRTDRLNTRRLFGLIAAASGVVLVLVTSGSNPQGAAAGLDQPSMTGDLLLIGSGFLLGVKIIYTKQAVRVVPPARLILWHDLVGVALFTATSLFLEADQVDLDRFQMAAGLGLLYQGLVVAGFCFAVQCQLLKRHPAARLSVFAFSTPVFGVLIAWAFREAAPSPWLLVAGALVATGIAMVNWKTGSR